MTVSIPVGFSSALQHFRRRPTESLDDSVSIPVGFSSALQRQSPGHAHQMHEYVSIPVGFSSALQRQKRSEHGADNLRFQSLSGFQVRCNGGSKMVLLP